MDEQTVGFQGRHAKKIRTTYKREGNAFQYDASCDNDYTYKFFLRHEPPLKKYTDLGLSPL